MKTFRSKKDIEEIKNWKKFPWFRKKVRISDKNIHQLPHPGKMSPIPRSGGLDKTGQLIDIKEE
jgi:hypothetical protein